MRHRILGEALIAAGVVLLAGAALGQTAGPTVAPPSGGIVPVTGPSTAPAPDLSKAELISPAAPAIGESRPGTKKAVHKGGARATVKKASTGKRTAKIAASGGKAGQAGKTKHVAKAKHLAKTKHVAKANQLGKAKHVGKAKRSAPTVPATPVKAIQPARRAAPGKGAAPVATVVPRV